MLRVNTLIRIEQMPNDLFKDRGNVFYIDFVARGEINTSWQNLTDTAKIVLPRNIYVADKNHNIYSWNDKAIYGSTKASPLFMRGDKISITLAYWSLHNLATGKPLGEELLFTPEQPQFQGYITKIKNRMPIELECEDEMWQLKKIQAPNKLFKGAGYTVKTMLEEMLEDSGYIVTDGGFSLSIGDFLVRNESVGAVLDRLRKDARIYSYFRGKELRASGVAYDTSAYIKDNRVFGSVFEFQENIISDSLEYTRKEDLDIAAKAYTQNITDGSSTNNDGTKKKNHKRIEVLVGKINSAGDFGEIANDKTFHGELITFPVVGATTKEELIDAAKKYLPKFYYTGFRGSFVTFGYPVVTHGNAVFLKNKVLPEQEGTFLVKQVITEWGLSGFRQKINLHTRIDVGYTIEQLNGGVAG